MLQDQAARSASMTAAFCERIGLPALDMLISKFHGRVLHGIKEDIVSLTAIRGVKGYTARMLYTAGLRLVEDVAAAEPEDIHAALVKGKRPDAQGGEWRSARRILNSARKLVKVRLLTLPGLEPACAAALMTPLTGHFTTWSDTHKVGWGVPSHEPTEYFVRSKDWCRRGFLCALDSAHALLGSANLRMLRRLHRLVPLDHPHRAIVPPIEL